jgi:DNA-binding transcriptional LysR family regulator
MANLQDQAPRWDDVRLFLAVYRQRNLSEAARKLGLDTSTMSRRLSALESDLGQRLFERTRDGLRPTRTAEQVLAAAETMESAHARLTRDVSEVESAAEGIVRLSVAPGMADKFVVPLLVPLRKRFPGIVVELDASIRAVDLSRQEADIALRSVAPKGADLLVSKVGSARWVPAACAAMRKRLGRVSDWSELEWITWDRDMSTFPSARWLGKHAPKARVIFRTSHFASQLVAAEGGLGVVLAPQPYVRHSSLQPIGVGAALQASVEELPKDDLWLVGHRALRDVPRVSAVWTFLLENVRAAMG